MTDEKLTGNEHIVLDILTEAVAPLRQDELRTAAVMHPSWFTGGRLQFRGAVRSLLARKLIMTYATGKAPWRRRWYVASCHLAHPETPGKWVRTLE